MSRIAFLLIFLCVGCNSKAGPIQSACTSTTGLANLSLADISREGLPYLQKYSIPTAGQEEFCRYLERLEREHAPKIEEGLIDMMGDYFWSTQTIETNYYFSYKIGRPSATIPQLILDRKSSDDEMVERFIKAVDEDTDVKRKALFNGFIHKLSASKNLSRKEGARALTQLIFEKSWVFNSEFQQSATDVGAPTNYGFVERGLRTTTPITVAAQVDQFVNSATGKQFLPGKIAKVLIIGPGLQLSDPDVGHRIPQESHEPFTLMDSLLRSGKATFGELQVDLLDINPRVIEHLKDASATNQPYVLHIVMNKEEVPPNMLDYGRTVFGTSLPGAVSTMPVEGKSVRPSRGKLEPADIISRSLTIPNTALQKLHPYAGDMTTTDLGKLDPNRKKYDAIFCFDTLIYLSETERMLASVDIREALAQNGVFVTDNRLHTDTGERPGRRGNVEKNSIPIFDRSFLEMIVDYNHADGSNFGPVEKEGRRTIVYRRGQ